MDLKRVVQWIEAAAAVAAVVFVIMLFAAGGGDGGGSASPGAQIYSSTCARCHGADGGGGLGPELAGIDEKYKDVEDQVALVTGGKGTAMPAFGNELSKEEIRAVVEYTRTELGK